MVRLLPLPPEQANGRQSLFQFLNGTIITNTNQYVLQYTFLFQFLNGTIITQCALYSGLDWLVSIPQWYDYYAMNGISYPTLFFGFNSSMVRLLHLPVWHLYCLLRRFNSSMVRLLPRPRLFQRQRAYSFNSSMVRLLQCARIRYPPQSGVSIPQWYDYYAKRLRVIRV